MLKLATKTKQISGLFYLGSLLGAHSKPFYAPPCEIMTSLQTPHPNMKTSLYRRKHTSLLHWLNSKCACLHLTITERGKQSAIFSAYFATSNVTSKTDHSGLDLVSTCGALQLHVSVRHPNRLQGNTRLGTHPQCQLKEKAHTDWPCKRFWNLEFHWIRIL